MDREQWRPIPGHPGYEASDHGRVRSIDRIVSGSKYKGRILKTPVEGAGYPRVRLGRGKEVLVHYAVLLTFVGPRPDGMECCRKDGNKQNNRLSNLSWGPRTGKRVRKKYRRSGDSQQDNATPANISYICRGETRNG